MALHHFNKIIEIRPKDPNGYLSRAKVNYYMKKYNELLNDANTALRLNPKFHYAYHSRSYYYSDEQKNYEKALEEISKAIEIAPDHKKYYANLFRIHLLRKDFSCSCSCSKKDIRIDSQSSVFR